MGFTLKFDFCHFFNFIIYCSKIIKQKICGRNIVLINKQTTTKIIFRCLSFRKHAKRGEFIQSLIKDRKVLLLNIIIGIMGVSYSNCERHDCRGACCNEHGTCPFDYDALEYDSSYTRCAYYYENRNWIIGPVAFVVLVALSVFVIYFKNRQLARQRRQEQEIGGGGGQQAVVGTQGHLETGPNNAQQQGFTEYGQNQGYQNYGQQDQPNGYNQQGHNLYRDYGQSQGAPGSSTQMHGAIARKL